MVSRIIAAGLVPLSLGIGAAPTHVSLSVDAKGNALVSWAKDAVVIPPVGRLYHSASLPGTDVSKPARAALPFALAVRRTPDGRLWAVQALPQGAGQPPALTFSRWRGAPTSLTLAFDGQRLTGKATFQGKPVTGSTTTLEGKVGRIYVYLDCLGCTIGKTGWGRMIGVAPKPDGSFSVFLRPDWQGTRYRAIVAGPNLGATFAPDAEAVAAG